LIQRATEKDLIRQSTSLASQTRLEILQAGLGVTDFSEVARKYGIQLEWGELPNGEDGSYSKDERKIILNSRIMNPERINFSFCHEFMHDRIEHDDNLLCLFADAHLQRDRQYETMERLCNAGAAELLMPSDNVRELMREHGFSTTLIPELCQHFSTSSIAAAFQIVNCASHDCYLVIAEPQRSVPTTNSTQSLMFNIQSVSSPQEQLVILYSGASSSAKYSIKRNQIISANHLLNDALRASEPVIGMAKLPFASGNGWQVPCDALYFRGKVFAFFNVTQPISVHQLPLF
jgi:Zn-dependent peptidase ImmA (M78 family)